LTSNPLNTPLLLSSYQSAIKKPQVFSVNLSLPSEDTLIDPAGFEKFLLENIKVANKKNKLGTAISVATKKEVVAVTTNIPFAKRYLKYLVSHHYRIASFLLRFDCVIGRRDDLDKTLLQLLETCSCGRVVVDSLLPLYCSFPFIGYISACLFPSYL